LASGAVHTAQTSLITLLDVESRIPKQHPIREIKRLIREVFGRLDSHLEDLYAEKGRSSIPPERLLGAKVLMALYSVRSDRQFCERLRYDLLFQWFLDINPDEPQAIFDASSFSKNQERLLGHATAEVVSEQVRVIGLRLGNAVLAAKVPVGPHRQGPAVLVAEPAGYGRDVHAALDADSCKEMAKVVVGDTRHFDLLGGAIHCLLTLVHQEHLLGGYCSPRFANSLEEFTRLRDHRDPANLAIFGAFFGIAPDDDFPIGKIKVTPRDF
jgi:transposase